MTSELLDIVTEADLERELTRVRNAAESSSAGVFGPDSVTWRIDREAAVFLGAGRALLLQLAHPWVAAAIAQHSRTLADPIGRFHRTFNFVFTMVFGTTGQALAAARALHRRHDGIAGVLTESVGAFPAGSSYRANDVAALRWVYATLTDSCARRVSARAAAAVERGTGTVLRGIPAVRGALRHPSERLAGELGRVCRLFRRHGRIGHSGGRRRSSPHGRGALLGGRNRLAHPGLVSRADSPANANAFAPRFRFGIRPVGGSRGRTSAGCPSIYLPANAFRLALRRPLPRSTRATCGMHATELADSGAEPFLDRPGRDAFRRWRHPCFKDGGTLFRSADPGRTIAADRSAVGSGFDPSTIRKRRVPFWERFALRDLPDL